MFATTSLLRKTRTHWLQLIIRNFFEEEKKPLYYPHWENSVRGPHPKTQTGGWTTVTVMPGVGVGSELADVMIEVLECAGAPLYYEIVHPEKSDKEFEYMIQSLKRNGVAIKGNIESKKLSELHMEPSKDMKVKSIMDLYVDVVECKSFPGLEKVMRVHKQLDIVVMRQNIEGEHALLEHEPVPNVMENVQVTTYYNTKRLCEYAFNYAIEKGRCKVTLLHNQDVNPASENLMKKAFDDVAFKYPEIQSEKFSANHGVKMLLKDSRAWDIVITNSVISSMLVSIVYGMIGGPDLVAEANVGERYKVYEPVFKSRYDSFEPGKANPTAFILSGVQALEGLGYNTPASNIRQGLEQMFIEGKTLTQDLGGKATTIEFTHTLLQHIRNLTCLINCKYDPIPQIPPRPPKPAPYDPKTDKQFMPPTMNSP